VHGCWSIRFEITLWHSEKTIAQVIPAFITDGKEKSYVNTAPTRGRTHVGVQPRARTPACAEEQPGSTPAGAHASSLCGRATAHAACEGTPGETMAMQYQNSGETMAMQYQNSVYAKQTHL